MANPQLKKGFVQIVNEIIEAMARIKTSPNETSCLFVIIRQTYGFHRRSAEISLDDFKKFTQIIYSSRICEAIHRLCERNIIIKVGNVYKINENWEKWELRTNVITHKRKKNYGKAELPLRKSVTFVEGAKNSPKDSIIEIPSTPKGDSIVLFEKFWELYPRKEGKKPAQIVFEIIFKKLTKDKQLELFEIIRAALTRFKNSPQWQKENGRFILNPEKWLNESRWEDEIAISNIKTTMEQQWENIK